MSQRDDAYSCENVQVLRDVPHIRYRPAMYIGDTDVCGLHRLLFELIHNAVDEVSAGPPSTVHVDFFPDGGCRVQDHGRGIPLERFGPEADVVFTKFLVPGWRKDAKFPSEGGLHGIGMKMVNALSQRLSVEIARGGKVGNMEFERGEVSRPLTTVRATQETGTTITFWPDPQIFTSRPSFELEAICERLTEIAVLKPCVRFMTCDHRCTPMAQRDLHYPRGLGQRVAELNQARGPVHPTMFYCQEKTDNHEVEIALQWSKANTEILHCFVNNCRTWSDGTPETGFHRSLSGTLGRFGRATGLMSDQSVGGEKIRAGLTAILSISVREPQWQGATKLKLGNPEIQGFVETTLNKRLMEFLYEHSKESDAIIKHIRKETTTDKPD